jgi:hypothetical protein
MNTTSVCHTRAGGLLQARSGETLMENTFSLGRHPVPEIRSPGPQAQ